MTSFQEYKKNLTAKAEAPLACRELDNSIKLEKYLQLGKQLIRQANSYKEDNDFENYYIYAVRFMNLYINVISKHGSAKHITHKKEVLNMHKQVDLSMEECESNVKVELERIYNRKQMEKKSPGVTPPQSIQGGAYNTTQVRAQPSYPPIQRNPNLRVPYHSPTSSNIPFHHERPLSQQMYDRSPIYPQLEPSAPPVQDMYEHPQMQFAQQLRPIAMNQRMIDEFLSYGYPSLERGIEFCAVICAKLKSGRFECSHMLIPKQTATPNSCNATNEGGYTYVSISSILTVKIHPTQTAFLSTVDIRTHFGYQSSLPEAIAIVCAPRANPNLGFFRIKDDGMEKFKQLLHRNPHFGINHDPLNEVLFEHCRHITLGYNVNIPFQVVDLR